MTVSGRLNEWLSIILKFMLIVAIGVALIWGGISIYANATEGNPAGTIPKLPDVKKAQYMVILKATGEVFLTDSYDIPQDGVYILHGFYAVKDGKWKWYEADLELNKYYFGDIAIQRRE